MLSIDWHQGLGRINVLIEFNNLLCSRIMATKALYPITIFLISFFIGLVPIAAALEKSNFNTNIIIGVNATIFLYIMFELLILTFRFNRNTVILQEQLIIFPISQKERYQYLLILMLRDKKKHYLLNITINRINYFRENQHSFNNKNYNSFHCIFPVFADMALKYLFDPRQINK